MRADGLQPAAPIGSSAVLIGQPLPAPDSFDPLKAAGWIALAGTVGVGAVLLGRTLWQSEEENFLPLLEDRDRALPSVRDRVTVISPRAVSPPETLPEAPPRLKRRSSTTATLPRVSYGFSGANGVGLEAPTIALAESPPDVPLQAPTDNPPPKQIAQKPVPPAPFPLATIAPLLQTPQWSASTATEAIVPPKTAVAPVPSAASSVPAPSEAIVPPTSTAPVDAAPLVPTPSTSPAPSQTATGKPGIYVERLPITGSTQFSPRELALAVQKTLNPAAASSDPSFINRRLSPAELVQASEAITKLYTDRGYVNSGAYVPAEVLNGAAPEIRVVEGRLEAINVTVQPSGALWLARPLSSNYVRRRLETGIQTPLQIDQLVNAVKLLEQDPLIDSISTELAPGTTTGRSVLNVKVRQASPLHTSFSIDNSRSPSVGSLQQQAALSHANLLGLGDQFQFGFNRTEGSRSTSLGYSLPINPKNGTLSFNYSSNRGQVIEAPFRELDIRSRSQTYELTLRQPLKQTPTELFALTLRGTHYRNEGVFLETFNEGVALPFPAQGADPNGKTRITALRFGQEWLKRSERNVMSLQSEFSVGINALNATVLDIPPDGRFFSWQGRGFWVHSLAPDTLLALKGQVQLANRPLVPVEQLSLGGLDTVRGYRTSTLLSDNGWFASAEAYLPLLRIPKWRGVLQVIPFLDIAQGWNRGTEQPNPSKLLSTGLGLQWKMGENFRARLDWGIPLINQTTESGRSLRESLFFSVTFSP